MERRVAIQASFLGLFFSCFCCTVIGITFSPKIPSPTEDSVRRTQWQFKTSSRLNGPLFPPVRSQRRKPPPNFSTFGFEDTVEMNNNFGEDFTSDVMETDEMLLGEIQQLNESLTILMSQRRPSFGANGAVQLIPTPNFSFLPDVGPLRQLFQWGTKSASSYAVCHACRVGLGYLLLQARTKAKLEDLSAKAIFLCKFFDITNEEVCTGLVNRFGPTMHFIFTTKTSISANMFCGIVLQGQGCATASYLTNWNIDLSSPFDESERIRKEPLSRQIIFNEDFNSQTEDHYPAKNGKSLMKVLHLTDIHLDLEYRAGANAVCDTELCCRSADGGGTGEKMAGFYGDYRKCDLPLNALENALQHISQTHPDIDLIYMTGDMVPHNIWSTNAVENTEIIRVASVLIQKYFPTTPLIPVLGNHDVHPLNL